MAKPVSKPPEPIPGTLREKIEWMLQRPFVMAYESIIEPLGERVRAGVDNFLEQMEARLLSYSRPFINRILAAPGLPPEIRAMLEQVNEPEGQLEIGAVLGVVAGILIGIVQGAIQPVARLMSYFVERVVHTGRPDPATLVAMLFRGEIDQAHYESYLADLGFTDELRDAYLATVRARLGVSDLFAAMHRGEVSRDHVASELRRFGFTDSDANVILNIALAIPGPGDLVRFALREAWDDAVAAKYGYDADFRPEFAEWMSKQGFDPSWARLFWRAHWELPSVTAGYEMFHRKVIDRATLAELLKLTDIPAYWRERLIEISYSVPTRVDARRMYEMGTIDRDKVKKVHLDLGYDEEWAELLTRWTEIEYQPEERERTRADILDGFRRGLLGEHEIRVLLSQMGYTAEAVNFYVAREKAKIADELEKEQLKLFERQFKNGILSETEVAERMTTLGLPATEVHYYIELWRTSVTEETKRPSVAKLESFYLDAIISAGMMRQEMLYAGYAGKYVDWYLRSLDQKAAERAAAEIERARKEEERVTKAREKTAYEETVAGVDVRIAQQNLIIAAARQSLNEQLSDEQITTVEIRIEQIAEEIANLRAEIARQVDIRDSARDQLRAKISDAERERLEEIEASAAITVAGFEDAIALINIEIRRLQELILVELDPELKLELKAQVAAHQTEIAEHRSAIAAQRLLQEEARAELRAKIPDQLRQSLERQQRDADAAIRATNIEIADLRAEQESLRLALKESLSTKQRAELEEKIVAAQTEIARLRVEKAQLKLER